MPYEAKQGDGEKWIVVNKDTGETKASHDPPNAKENAERQVELLNEIEKNPMWDEVE